MFIFNCSETLHLKKNFPPPRSRRIKSNWLIEYRIVQITATQSISVQWGDSSGLTEAELIFNAIVEVSDTDTLDVRTLRDSGQDLIYGGGTALVVKGLGKCYFLSGGFLRIEVSVRI